MSKTLFILDPGHGGLHPETNRYVTAGKRMVKDDIEFYEGVNNRDNVNRILAEMEKYNLDAIDITGGSWRDISLIERVNKANEIAKERECVYISIHSDANGNGKEWNKASGIGGFIANNASSKSIKMANFLRQEAQCNFHGIAIDRNIKRANFYVLRATSMPAILWEFGFHTNEIEVRNMQTEDWKQRLTKSVVDACKLYQTI